MNSLMYSVSDKEFQEVVKQSSSKKEVCQKLGYTNYNGNTTALFKKRCKELDVDYSHFGNLRNRIVRTEENVFCKDSTASQQTLREWYLKNNYNEYRCSICGISEWQDKSLSLHLDHINGNNHDNRLENLRWVCPNCDSQLDTYCGKNQLKKSKNKCEKCGKELFDSRAKMCRECYNISLRRVERPSREELKKMIRKESFVHIGSRYNVTDNAIKKWCKSYNLPYKKQDIKTFSEEQWNLI